MPLSIAHGNGIKNFRAVTKIDALTWGSAGCQPALFGRWPKSFCENRSLKSTFSRRQAADACRLAACAPQNLTRSDVTKKGARWRTSGRIILMWFVAD